MLKKVLSINTTKDYSNLPVSLYASFKGVVTIMFGSESKLINQVDKDANNWEDKDTLLVEAIATLQREVCKNPKESYLTRLEEFINNNIKTLLKGGIETFQQRKQWGVINTEIQRLKKINLKPTS